MGLFKLSKWYLDCVTDVGDALIAYTGTACWRDFRLHYSSVLETASDHILQRHTLRQQATPEATDSTITWSSKLLDVDGTWNALSSAVSETIYRSAEGSIEWSCLMPLAGARIRERYGLGYVEHLTMTIPPWKLPLQILRWGRFTSPSDWVTWIDWQGEFSRRIVYMNGQMLPCSKIKDERIEWNGEMQLLMDGSLVLRDGLLGATALSAVPAVGKTLHVRLPQIYECKWRSRGRLERKGRPAVEGWVIHERVSWPQ